MYTKKMVALGAKHLMHEQYVRILEYTVLGQNRSTEWLEDGRLAELYIVFNLYP